MDLMQIFDLIMKVELSTLLSQYGVYVYAVLFLIIFSETGLVVLFFFPGDTLLFIAGAACATGEMNYFFLMALLIAAAVLGNTLNYHIGKRIGQRAYTHNYRWVNKDALQKTHNFFEKHGGKTIILARFVPVVRTFAPFVAGVSEMTQSRFQFYNITGAALWVVSLVSAGYLFGNTPIVRDNLTTIVMIGVAAAVVPVALGGLYKFGRKMLSR
ncbi:VTT domain-containing protein [Massilia sp. PAMC28688]|uniref:VTT domain-containing protein n=1 Tax=Massilia sp. PAMC28688 TaxID=2861283 RepID=UPI001C63338C|nr:VTT domain-containing protein [Massilia sp. PAMC28688]QYF91672.1 VTT domain-containing protein [Massilia sp. PAMC28688]